MSWLSDLNDWTVALLRMDEELLPERIGKVHPNRIETECLKALELGPNISRLEREVMRTWTVRTQEPDEEIISLDFPGFEKLDGHPIFTATDPNLHGPEARSRRRPAADHDPTVPSRQELLEWDDPIGSERYMIKLQQSGLQPLDDRITEG
jgi:hypothetical protein